MVHPMRSPVPALASVPFKVPRGSPLGCRSGVHDVCPLVLQISSLTVDPSGMLPTLRAGGAMVTQA